MTPQLIVTLVIAVVTATIPGVFALRQARMAGVAARRLEHRKVDAEAYTRAQTIYEASIRQLEVAGERSSSEVLRLTAAVDRCERAFETDRREYRELITQLRERIAVLEALIRHLGGDVPKPPAGTAAVSLERP